MNVKIVLLPDGEDPDSYSKKVSNEEFLKYIRAGETDFIRFKTQLLLSEAENDPVKKVGLIKDIVRSIAVIPEAIARTIYIKECSSIMEVAEPVLYHEVNKLRQQQSFRERNRYPGPETLPVPPPVVTKPVKDITTSYYSEKEIIRLLLRYGSMEFERIIRGEDGKEEIITVSDYIVKEITEDELGFDDDICSGIFEDFRFHSEQGIFPGDKHFVKHADPEISSLSASLLAGSHELSLIWKNRQTYVETEEMKLREIVPDSVLKFKSDKIKIILKNNMAQLEKAAKEGDAEKILALQKKDQNLKKALRTISEKLGNRILL
jgi:DNA primase